MDMDHLQVELQRLVPLLRFSANNPDENVHRRFQSCQRQLKIVKSIRKESSKKQEIKHEEKRVNKRGIRKQLLS